jgi:hypothetical protein
MSNVIPSYKHDIFISYAHVDNVPFVGIEHGWVSNLFRVLSAALTAKFGSVNITSAWQDVQSAGNAFVQAEVLHNVAQSAILLVILSPGYLASEWCQKELECFVNAMESQTDDHTPRIFIVEKNRLDSRVLPVSLAQQPSYSFWTLDAGGRERPLAIPQPNPHDALYYQKVDDLAKALTNALENMCLQSHPASGPVVAPAPLATVFLAQVPADLRYERDGVKRYLEQFNIRVLPDHQIPSFNVAHDHADLERLLADSDLFVQLLSHEGQWRTADQGRNLARVQYERALHHDLPILQWRAPALELAAVFDSTQRTLLALETVKAMPIEEFKRAIRQYLSKEPPAPPATHEFVFLNASGVDQRLAERIGTILEQLGLVWQLRLNEGNPGEVRRDLEANLRTCDALIVVYGQIGARWVKEQLLYYRRITRARSLKALALYEGPPEDKDEVDAALPGMAVLNCRRGIDEVKLRDFLAPLLHVGSS